MHTLTAGTRVQLDVRRVDRLPPALIVSSSFFYSKSDPNSFLRSKKTPLSFFFVESNGVAFCAHGRHEFFVFNEVFHEFTVTRDDIHLIDQSCPLCVQGE